MTDQEKKEQEREQELKEIKKEFSILLNSKDLAPEELSEKFQALTKRYANLASRYIPIFLIAVSTAACNVTGNSLSVYTNDDENSPNGSASEVSVAEGEGGASEDRIAVTSSTTLTPSDHMWLMNSQNGGMTEYYDVSANPVKGIMKIKQNTQAVLQFDISSLEGTVTNARLQMKMKSGSSCAGSVSEFEDMLDVIGSAQVSVMDQAYMNELDYNSVPRETFTIVDSVPSSAPYTGYYFIDITDVVEEAVEAGESTFSLRFHPQDENSDSEINYEHVCFEFVDTTIGPKIEITLERYE